MTVALETLSWSPHPLSRPAPYLVAALQLVLVAALAADMLFQGWFARAGTTGDLLAALVVLAAALIVVPLLPRARRRLGTIALLVVFTAAWGYEAVTATYETALWVIAAIAVVEAFSVWLFAERRRRQVRITLERDHLEVYVKPYRVQHTLPLDAVRDVRAARGTKGRLLGYGDFEATTKKDTMKDHISLPVVGEDPPADVTFGNGWDTEGTFRLHAAHPYRRVRTALENRIVLARLSPKERQEQELAYRLAEDLGRLDA